MKTITLKADVRKGSGTADAHAQRKMKKIPCVVYGGAETKHITIEENELHKAIYTADFQKVKLQIESGEVETIVKDIQFHPVTDAILHVDFLELVKGKRVKTEIPISLKGNAEGVTEGGQLMQKLRRLSVRVKPENLLDNIDVDVTELKLGNSIKVGEMNTGEIEVLTPGSIPVASVVVPRVLKSLEAETDEMMLEEGEEGTTETAEDGGTEGAATEEGTKE